MDLEGERDQVDCLRLGKMQLLDMVFDTSMNNRPDEWGPEDIFSKPLPPGKEGGPTVDDQAIEDVVVYSYAQCIDCPDELRDRAALIDSDTVKETWRLVVEYAAWRDAYSKVEDNIQKSLDIKFD